MKTIVQVMGDNLAAPDKVDAARRLEDFGCAFVIHHIGYDERRGIAAAGQQAPSPLDQLRQVVLRLLCDRVHAYGEIAVGSGRGSR